MHLEQVRETVLSQCSSFSFLLACYITASTTYLIQLFPDMLSMAFSLSEIVVGLAVSVGPALGGVLYGIGGFGLPFYAVGLTILANLPISFCLLGPLKGN